MLKYKKVINYGYITLYVSKQLDQPVDAGTFMITTKQEYVLWIFYLVCKCQAYCLQ